MPKGNLIDDRGIKRLREDHEILLKRVMHLEQRHAITAGSGRRRMEEFVKVTEQIAQRDTSSSALEKTLGTGKAELYKISKDDNDVVTFEKITDSEGNATEIDVYNTNRVPVAVDSYLRISRNFRSGLWMVGEIQTAVAKAPLGVTARSGFTAGSGTVQIYYIDNGVLKDTGETVTAYSFSATAVANLAFITIKKCSLDEDWIVDAEDCG
jgi:hypothetical protein